MTPRRILLHVGYHKTATSWMQARLFLPQHGYHQLMTHDDVHEVFVAPHGLVYDPIRARDLVAGRLAAMPEGLVPVISSELLCGQPFTGSRESDALALRLKQALPEAQIVISIRAQLRMFVSIYMQYLRNAGTLKPADFFAQQQPVGFHCFNPGHFEFDRLLGHYQKLFGAESVFVLQQEKLASDAERAAADLARYCGNTAFTGLQGAAQEAHAASYPEYAAPFLRRGNHLHRGAMNPNPVLTLGAYGDGLYRALGYALRQPVAEKLLSRYKPVSSEVNRRFRGAFDASNLRLQAMAANPVDLTGYLAKDPAAPADRPAGVAQ